MKAAEQVLTLHGDDYNEERTSDEEWLMKYDAGYKKEYELITTGDYNKLIEEYSRSGDTNYNLKEELLKRIKDIDLPRFINFEWYGLEEEYEDRLKNSKEGE